MTLVSTGTRSARYTLRDGMYEIKGSDEDLALPLSSLITPLDISLVYHWGEAVDTEVYAILNILNLESAHIDKDEIQFIEGHDI